ncbi:phosphonate/organophosphate ester transporter subunit; ATP-binding component of ABC superfamily [Pseudodesulfovibrio profundus]|uniref:Phosphonate/organophosphate ester transporter subunit ATP-binding component of ABC superfamily n=1 Tax=Pseudodesulfovibrio profundus TaxID=57320 RepID=A0A2C8FCX8_9BACT|nr:phosphonate ABC transporter ATP-binding protein [Pseudodesulfovibrio profundus]SOB60280.1 phosphonate/organophosphate ester transporter subunit; ATP-binding component of ABC superfamily [Pseudodesulfovibrio profundus]
MKTIGMAQKCQTEAIKVTDLCKVYPNGTVALKDVSVAVDSNDFCVVIGLSGAGKSTMLRCMNRLIQPTSGQVALFGEDVTNVNGSHLKQVRRRVGMIFQQFNLVRRLTVLDNVLVGRLRFNSSPLKRCSSIFRQFSKQEKEFAFHCLQQVGIADLAYRRADALSGGQQQRVAIARALAQEPEVFLADEPIASLDPRSSETVMQILSKIHEENCIPVLVNLHHIDFAQRYGKRILGMSKGELIFDGTANDLTAEAVSCIYGDEAEEALEELSAA